MKKLLLSAMLVCIMAGSANATTAYMKPAAFNTGDASVAVEGAFSSQFFTPSIGLDSPDYKVVGPNGQSALFANSSITPQDSTLTAAMPDAGTYRVTTGERLGNVNHLVADPAVAGGWRAMAEGETAPAGAQTTTLQTVSLAEAYVTRGAPSRGAVDVNIGRLAIHPVTHPNQVLVAPGFEVQVLLDGNPLPNFPVVLYAAGDPDTNQAKNFVTGADGHATIAIPTPGTYVIAVRYRGPAPADSGVAVRSYTTTLTFDANTDLPAVATLAPTRSQQQDAHHPRNRHTTRDLFH